MIEFNKLTILPYNGIYLDVSILNMPYFTNVYIDKIIIDTQDTFSKGGPSNTPVYTYQVTGNVKQVQKTINTSEILVKMLQDNMYFVYVVTKGVPNSDTPCGLDNTISLGVCADTFKIYRIGMNYLHEIYDDSCNIPKAFIDFSLRYEAFKMCLKTRDFPLAITYWNKFMKINSENLTISSCLCNE